MSSRLHVDDPIVLARLYYVSNHLTDERYLGWTGKVLSVDDSDGLYHVHVTDHCGHFLELWADDFMLDRMQ